jgi:hypothetical protein
MGFYLICPLVTLIHLGSISSWAFKPYCDDDGLLGISPTKHGTAAVSLRCGCHLAVSARFRRVGAASRSRVRGVGGSRKRGCERDRKLRIEAKCSDGFGCLEIQIISYSLKTLIWISVFIFVFNMNVRWMYSNSIFQ